MAARAIAQYQKKRIIVYNSDGTINLRMTAVSGKHMLEAMERVSGILHVMPGRAGMLISTGVENVTLHAYEAVVFWDGVVATYKGTRVFTVQFAYQEGHGAFPVKAIEVGGKEIFFGRKWTSFRKYLNALVEGLDV